MTQMEQKRSDKIHEKVCPLQEKAEQFEDE